MLREAGSERRRTGMRQKWLLLLLIWMLPVAGSSYAPQKRSLTEVDSEALKKAVAGLKGKVVFVNFWATWCAPCVAEFPDIVKLYQKYHAKGLEVIAVSFDMEAPTAVPFLDRQKADFINLWKGPKQEDDAFMTGFDKECLGALPVSWLFDQNGKRIYFVMGKFDPAQLDKLIAGLLAPQK
jgi:thiol-disulfide isomerase/thioredoxin